jgi:hypothetical protein
MKTAQFEAWAGVAPPELTNAATTTLLAATTSRRSP